MSSNWSTNVSSIEEKGDQQLTKSHQQKEDCDPEKPLNKNIHPKLVPFILGCLNSQQASFCKLPSRSYITVKIISSSAIELLK